jgi:penicillin-binding protein 2
MLNRRLWILFFAFLLAFAILALRLAQLQFGRVDDARERVAQFLHPQDTVETYRGTIVDRRGLVLARDVPSDELAIDYRAIKLDESWLNKKAIEYLRSTNEWPFKIRAERNRRLEEVKADLAAKVDAIPDALATILAPLDGIAPEAEKNRIHERFFEISQRIAIMRQDVWITRYNRDAASQAPSSGSSTAEMTDAELDASYRRIQLKDEVSAHTLRANLPADVALFFKRNIANFPGLIVRDMAEYNRRDYPFGQATAHIVGNLRNVDAPTLKNHRFREPHLLGDADPGDLSGYLPGDRMGEIGVERIAEDLLRGIRGEQLLDLGAKKTPGGSPELGGGPDLRGSASDPRNIAPIPGKTVQLTVDAALQRDLFSALVDPASALSAPLLKPGDTLLTGDDHKLHFAALVVLSMDGQVLSLVTYPSYDPNTLDVSRAQLMNDNYRLPLINRATSAKYPPGSTVKPLLASAALAERVITPSENITCVGHFFPSRDDIFRCDAKYGHGPIALVDAIAESCNVYFYTVGQRLGVDRLTEWYGDYGFGRDTGMELPESRGDIPHPDHIDADTLKSDALLLGIGQGPVSVTPLQLANAYATLLRGGTAIAPRILAATPPQKSNAVKIAPQDLATIRQGMERCTTVGTAKSIFANFRLRVAGKTGTAEDLRPVFDDDGNPVDDTSRPLLNPDRTPRLKPDGTPMYRQLIGKDLYDAWFVGYAPADKPQYVVAALLEWGGHGGRAAAPMVREAFLQLQQHGYLPKTDVP